MDWQNRIIGLENRPARDLLDHSGNWRIHPQHQADALSGVLREVGIVDALLVYQSERHGGLTVIDGHLRKALDPSATWPCLMTDLTDTEADYVLATFDWLTYQAEADREQLRELLESVHTDDSAVQALLTQMGESFGAIPPDFDPVGIDEQGKLDELASKKPTVCPECGYEFEA